MAERDPLQRDGDLAGAKPHQSLLPCPRLADELIEGKRDARTDPPPQREINETREGRIENGGGGQGEKDLGGNRGGRDGLALRAAPVSGGWGASGERAGVKAETFLAPHAIPAQYWFGSGPPEAEDEFEAAFIETHYRLLHEPLERVGQRAMGLEAGAAPRRLGDRTRGRHPGEACGEIGDELGAIPDQRPVGEDGGGEEGFEHPAQRRQPVLLPLLAAEEKGIAVIEDESVARQPGGPFLDQGVADAEEGPARLRPQRGTEDEHLPILGTPHHPAQRIEERPLLRRRPVPHHPAEIGHLHPSASAQYGGGVLDFG